MRPEPLPAWDVMNPATDFLVLVIAAFLLLLLALGVEARRARQRRRKDRNALLERLYGDPYTAVGIDERRG